MRSLTIKTHLEQKREYTYFQAILTLAGSVLNNEWNLVETEPADVVVIAYESGEVFSAWDENASRYPAERLISFSDEQPNSGAMWHIQRPPENMPRLSEVVQVLNKISDYFQGDDDLSNKIIFNSLEHKANSLSQQAPASLASQIFDPNDYLAGQIQAALTTGEAAVCHIPGHNPIFWNPKQNALFTTLDIQELARLSRKEVQHIKIQNLDQDLISQEISKYEKIKKRSLVEFLWFSLLSASAGRLLEGHHVGDSVYLKEWPSFVRLPFYGIYLEIASKMSEGVGNLHELAKASSVPLSTVIDFYNACELFGLLARGDDAQRLAEAKVQAMQQIRTLLNPLFSHVRYQRLVFVGGIGSGKTTALSTLSESVPILTEASPSDEVGNTKATTTVAMEYGEIRIGQDSKLQLYGTPGQRRFDFMGQILCAKTWGLAILINHASPTALEDLEYYINVYVTPFPQARVVIGISHLDQSNAKGLDQYQELLNQRNMTLPVVPIDPRNPSSLVQLIDNLAADCA